MSNKVNRIKIGSMEGDNITKEFHGQGYIYKNSEAFFKEQVCYVPERSNITYTIQDFIKITGSRQGACILFNAVDWQHPETLWEEWYEQDCEEFIKRFQEEDRDNTWTEREIISLFDKQLFVYGEVTEENTDIEYALKNKSESLWLEE